MQMQNFISFTLTAFLLLSSCTSQTNPNNRPTPNIDYSWSTETRAISSPSEFKASLAILNQGKDTLIYDPQFFENPSLSLEVQNSQGKTIPHLPPPVPKPNKDTKLLPGEKLVLHFNGLGITSGYMPQGEYKVRWKSNAKWKGAQNGTKVNMTSHQETIRIKSK